jgi:hypothetical protein
MSESPKEKAIALNTGPLFPLEEMRKARKPGSKGKMHGDKKLKIPPRNALQ